MPQTAGPFSLTPAVPLQVAVPGTAPQFASVVLQNLSPYLCLVNIAGREYFLPAYMADSYDLAQSNVPVIVTPSNLDNVTNATANLTATFYDRDDADRDDTAYPAPLTSPAAIASQTAAALLANGMPLVYTNTQLSAVLIASGANVLISTTQYASLSVEADANGTGNPVLIALQWGQSSTPGNLTGHTTVETLTSIDTAIFPHWVMPVIGGWVRITNNSAGTIALSVFGSNRPVQRVSQVGDNFNARTFSATIVNPVAGTFYPLAASDNGADSTVFNGPVLVVCYFNGIAGITQGYVGENFTGNAGVSQIFAGGPYGSAGTFTFNHPAVPTKWTFDPVTGGTGTLNVSIQVIPQTPG